MEGIQVCLCVLILCSECVCVCVCVNCVVCVCVNTVHTFINRYKTFLFLFFGECCFSHHYPSGQATQKKGISCGQMKCTQKSEHWLHIMGFLNVYTYL